MFVLVFLELFKLGRFDRRFTLVLFATMIVAMLPLTWEDRKVVWFILAALVGLSSAPRQQPQAVPWRPPRSVSLEGRQLGTAPPGAAGVRGRFDVGG
jgi:hypothetical protein